MKKWILSLIPTLMLGSCVIDETVTGRDSAEDNYSLESRSSCNYMLDGKESEYGRWNIDKPDDLKKLLNNNSRLYAYDGTGGIFGWTDGIPCIEYIQGNKTAEEDKFNYYYSPDGENIQTGEAFSYVKFNIRNEINNLHLAVRSIELKNIIRKDVFVFSSGNNGPYWLGGKKDGSLVIDFDSISIDKPVVIGEVPYPVIPQTANPWNIKNNPVLDGGCFLLLDCIIYNVSNVTEGFQEGKDYPIWCSSDGSFRKLAIPVSSQFEVGKETEINIVLEEGCPWMNISTLTPGPVLVPITFDATVEDWQEGGTVDVEA